MKRKAVGDFLKVFCIWVFGFKVLEFEALTSHTKNKSEKVIQWQLHFYDNIQ